jgi:hypothetical protein
MTDIDQAIHEVVIAAYEMFADHETDETKEREYRARAAAMRAAGT